ncbi:MAG TPA: class I SAM-dependent rRNA methyltransferase [Isosphaeraceae bacterium]|nr:class I SAM-dependent rRNA methyltransferase [Isosphaeraceae bacterium]
MPSDARVILKPRKSRPFFARHPWVFAGSVGRIEGEPETGDEVDVVSHEGNLIARGLYNPRSAIRVRLYRWPSGPLDAAFWNERLEEALRLRTEVLCLPAEQAAARLVFSEADGLSGVTVDRYDRWLVAQFTSLALYLKRDLLLPRLIELTGAEGLLLRTERGMAEQEGLLLEDGPALGSVPSEPIEIIENDLRFQVDLHTGQKTGFYLDQRDNRRAAALYARGRRVLDLFCYTGGFSLNALKHGGAASVLGFDASSGAIALAKRNAERNGLSKATFEANDVFEALEDLRSEGERFGAVICDPPKFARQQKAVEDALKAYLRLNRAAIELLEPDGILVTCSCSSHVDRTLFASLLAQVAELSGRAIQILEQRGQAPDHPVAATCLETEYLKCFICRVN